MEPGRSRIAVAAPTTPSENTEVVKSLVAIAEARGWSEVVVRGTERFRRKPWAAARTAGIEVRGYKPTRC